MPPQKRIRIPVRIPGFPGQAGAGSPATRAGYFPLVGRSRSLLAVVLGRCRSGCRAGNSYPGPDPRLPGPGAGYPATGPAKKKSKKKIIIFSL